MVVRMRHLVRGVMLCALLTVSALAFAGVTISSPASGATTASPVHFVASASSTNPITFMRIYVDNVSIFGAATSKIDWSGAVGTGSHSVIVKAWDSTGASMASTRSITVTSGTAPPTGTTSGYFNIDQMTGWGQCDTCAGIGANGPVATLTSAIVGTPSLDGKSKQFGIASSNSYADAIWWKSLPGNDSKSHFVYDFYFYIKNPAASQALEFDVNQSAGKRRYVYGTQCGVNHDHQWDVWDTALGHWRQTGIACAPPAFTWNHVTWEFERSGGRIHFIAVTMNGKKSYVDKWYDSKAWGASEISAAVQLDQRADHVTYSIWVDKLNITMW